MLVTSQHGLGDTGDFSTGVLSGGVLTAFVLGIGVLIAAKTVFAPTKRRAPEKRWIAGAWRSPDYEYWSEEDRRRPLKRRGRSRAA